MSLMVVLKVRLSVDVLHHKSFISSIKALVLLNLFFFTFDTDSKIQKLLTATDSGFVSLTLFSTTDLWLHLFGYVTSNLPSLCYWPHLDQTLFLNSLCLSSNGLFHFAKKPLSCFLWNLYTISQFLSPHWCIRLSNMVLAYIPFTFQCDGHFNLTVGMNHFHRTTEWSGLKGPLKVISFQPPCNNQGHLQLDQAAHSLFQPDPKMCPGIGLAPLFWVTCSTISHLHFAHYCFWHSPVSNALHPGGHCSTQQFHTLHMFWGAADDSDSTLTVLMGR